jgi:hypothetical protein
MKTLIIINYLLFGGISSRFVQHKHTFIESIDNYIRPYVKSMIDTSNSTTNGTDIILPPAEPVLSPSISYSIQLQNIYNN